MTYTKTLDLIFQSYLRAKPYIAGKFDRDVRDPAILLEVARKFDLLPDPASTIKVTGSKGKGTVARLCAQSLSDHGKTGLVISPEEISHLDRMRINGVSISEKQFIVCFEKIWAAVMVPEPPAYLSPYGLFLLSALQWFKDEGVDYCVLETGRGVKYDEGGQVPTQVGVVTSVFLEHATYLGPSLEEIRADKLSICETCDQVIVAEGTIPAGDVVPGWYAHSQNLAQQAVEALLQKTVVLPDAICGSFGQQQNSFYEGMIAAESADMSFLKKLVDRHEGSVCFYVSLPDDKDVKGVCDLLDQLDADVRHIVLRGERGFLSYEEAKSRDVVYSGGYDDVAGLRAGLKFGDHAVRYFIGTQTYLRLIKQAYFS
ncbi:Mur ligase family protein [Terasakiella sp. A23]|uniref:Mur ligase family protein n=1 Tax=Terasakiella sp. FCG-A23 TaxID=3080561 RepID=UPI002954BA69|nr:Mur ligase family protein [Terasakiella sp. A23]MDV7339951.1 Mur ligase family protein [Terasakiella sp. A23]